MKDNMIPVTRSNLPNLEEYVAEIASLWESRHLTNMGRKHQELEEKLAAYLDTPNCRLFCNGHQALLSALQVFDFLPGKEVITTPFTFISTSQAIIQAGLVPVFCDIDPHTLNLDPVAVEAAINENTVAILPVHVYGQICPVEEFEVLAERYQLKLIYDAAHAFGVKYKGKSMAAWGDISMYSFHATKVFHTVEGGALAFKDQSLAEKFQSLRNFGMSDAETANVVAGNTKLNEFQAAMGLCNLRNIDSVLAQRMNLTSLYNRLLSDVDEVSIMRHQQDVISNGAYYPIVFKGGQKARDLAVEILASNHILARKYFYPLTSDFAAIHQHSRRADKLSVATEISASVLCLPLFYEMSTAEVERVVSCLKAALIEINMRGFV